MYRINGSNDRAELYKCINGTFTKLADAAIDITSNEWAMLKIEVNGNNVKGYVNGKLLTDWTNPYNELSTGKIGFRTTSQHVSFDDVLVSQY